MSIFELVMEEVKAQGASLDLNALSSKLGIQASALEGILQFCAHKGRLSLIRIQVIPGCDSCSPGKACVLQSPPNKHHDGCPLCSNPRSSRPSGQCPVDMRHS